MNKFFGNIYNKYFLWKYKYPHYMEISYIVENHKESKMYGYSLLSKRQIRVSNLYVDTKSVKKTAEKLNITRERVRQILSKIRRRSVFFEKGSY